MLEYYQVVCNYHWEKQIIIKSVTFSSYTPCRLVSMANSSVAVARVLFKVLKIVCLVSWKQVICSRYVSQLTWMPIPSDLISPRK